MLKVCDIQEFRSCWDQTRFFADLECRMCREMWNNLRFSRWSLQSNYIRFEYPKLSEDDDHTNHRKTFPSVSNMKKLNGQSCIFVLLFLEFAAKNCLQRTPHKMNGKVFSAKSSETFDFDSSKWVEQMSYWAESPEISGFFLQILIGGFSDDRNDIKYLDILTMWISSLASQIS